MAWLDRPLFSCALETTGMAGMKGNWLPRLGCQVVLKALLTLVDVVGGCLRWAGSFSGRAQRPLPCVELNSPSSADSLYSTTSTFHNAGHMTTIRCRALVR
ncbi:hypothetical protein MRX96_036090 [Rhipicephalus microplus]